MKRKSLRLDVALLALAALALTACGSEDTREGPSTRQPDGRVLILGLDGADWEILDPMIDAGRLPNLARIRDEGAHGVLLSEPPLLSPIVWTTIATGRSPLEHGIFGFLTMRDGKTEPVRSDERLVRAFWNIASDLGIRVGVVGWYASWPAEPVEGFLVSDRLAGHQVRGTAGDSVPGLVYPDGLSGDVTELKRAVDAEIGRPEAEAYFRSTPDAAAAQLPEDKLDAFVHILRTTELYRRLAPRLLDRFEPSLSAVFFEGTDSVGHLFQPFAPPRMPSVTEAEVARFGQAHALYYDHIDTIVGEFLDRLDPEETTLVVVSDHGFRVGARRPAGKVHAEYANQAPAWHREEGVIMLWGRGIKRGARLPEAQLYDVLPTIFRLLDVPIADTLRGRPIETALVDSFLARPVRTIADYETAGERERGEMGDLDAGEDLARLRALGYVGDATGPVEGSAERGGSSDEGHFALPINRYNHSIILEREGRIAEARRVLEELQQEAPDFPLGYFGEAMLLVQSGEIQAAIPLLERATSLRPDFQAALAELGEARLRMNEVREAEKAFERVIGLEPNHPRACLRLAQIRMAQRQFPEARRLFDRALPRLRDPSSSALAAVSLGILSEQDMQLDSAEDYYRRALQTVAEYPPALERYGNLLLYRERFSEGVAMLERLTRALPNEPRAWQLYGRALQISGQHDAARTALERGRAVAGAGN